MASRLTLAVNGQRYGGWQEVVIRRSLEQLADTFRVTHIDSWAGEPFEIQEGDAVEVFVQRGNGEDELVITGYVDDAEQEFDSQTHRMVVSGRSKAGDLVDCAARVTKRQVKGQNLLQLAQALCLPFDITVSADVDTGGELRRYTLQPGETVEQAIRRILAKRGLLAVSEPNGNIIFTRGSAAVRLKTALVQGVNVKQASYRGSWRNRFSDYAFRSVMAADDDWNGAITSTAASVTDDAITRYRPMAVLAEHQGDAKELERRATWERNARAGKGQRLTVTVPGWEHAEGVWAPNTLARCKIPTLRVDDELLVGSVELRLDNRGGEVARLDLVGQGAFDVLGAPPKLRYRKRRRDP